MSVNGLRSTSCSLSISAYSLAPSMSQGAKAIVKEYGGWTNTVHTFGGKSYDPESIEETRQIVEQMAKEDAKESK